MGQTRLVVSLAALGYAVAFCKAGRPERAPNDDVLRRWTPAYETAAAAAVLNLQPLAMDPAPTAAPPPRPPTDVRLAARVTPEAASICGYILGDEDYPYSCAVQEACVFNDARSVGGCCPQTSTQCNLATTCIDYAAGESTSSIGRNTYWCSDSDYPNCITLTYGDLVGYEIMGCGKTSVGSKVEIDYNPTTTAASSLSTSDFSNDGAGGDDISTTTEGIPATSATAAAKSTKSSSAPVGAIVGGVVGGVAVIAIVIFGLLFLRRKKKSTTTPPDGKIADQAPGTPQGGYPPQPPLPMQQQQQQHTEPAGTGTVDDGASIQKPTYSVYTRSVYDPSVPSPPPPPTHHSPSPNNGAPLSQDQGASLLAAPSPPPTSDPVPQQNTMGSVVSHGYQQPQPDH